MLYRILRKVIDINSSAEDRRNQIIEILKEKKKVKVAELKDIFNVSGVTIGADLNYFERKGYIERSFGYALLKDNSSIFTGDIDKDNFEHKKRIAKTAAKYIGDNESIMFYTGSTVLYVARQLKDVKNFIAVTNSTQIAQELGIKPNVKTILLGGFYNPENYSSFGGQAIKQLSEYNIDKVIMSANGISAKDGLTIDQPFETDLNREVIKKAKMKIIVADHTKIGVSRFIKIAAINDIDVLITDENAPEEEVCKIREAGVEVILA